MARAQSLPTDRLRVELAETVEPLFAQRVVVGDACGRAATSRGALVAAMLGETANAAESWSVLGDDAATRPWGLDVQPGGTQVAVRALAPPDASMGGLLGAVRGYDGMIRDAAPQRVERLVLRGPVVLTVDGARVETAGAVISGAG